MILAKIGASFPWIGDPYLIPLPHLPYRWEECIRVQLWRMGKEDTRAFEEQRQEERQAEYYRRLARQGLVKCEG